MSLLDQLVTLRDAARQQIQESPDLATLNQLRVTYLGKKSILANALKQLRDVPAEERPTVGAFVNEVRNQLSQLLDTQLALLEEQALDRALAQETIDVTLPGRPAPTGQAHLLTQVIEDIEELFLGMGYCIAEGPEVELDAYNFEKMNLPKDHPARDMQDTFYITEEVLMRTQTSPVQARSMAQHDFSQGPLKIISPGKVYRRDDDDATHSHQFQQIEGLVVAEHITMADLKGTLTVVAQHLFGADRAIRLRPSYFPFTEPSVEVDVSCFKCGGSGCSICKHTGWIEILGAGMVHPNVLRLSGVDPERYGGFAFGLGVERIAMLRYGVDDIRHFYQNDVRFLAQFKQG